MSEDIVDGEIVEPGTDIVPMPVATLFRSDDPAAIVERASATARTLADVIRKQGLFTRIQGKEHVHVEGWTLLGSLLGVFPVVITIEEIGDDQGWRAYTEVRTRGGEVVGGAWGMCSRKESTWSKRDSYALMGMAETRSVSRALRTPLDFVMRLAGYAATPEEEMPGSTAATRTRKKSGRAEPTVSSTEPAEVTVPDEATAGGEPESVSPLSRPGAPSADEPPDTFQFQGGPYQGWQAWEVADKDPAWLIANLTKLKVDNRRIAEALLRERGHMAEATA